ncbi:MAG: hypothetical protein R3D60_10190 [Paracoccaceae bacterium]
MKRLVLILCVLVVTGCGRPLTAPEADLASRMFGPGLDLTQARLSRNGLIGLQEHRFPARPQTTCRERISPPPDGPWLTGRTAGMTLGNQVNIRSDIYAEDYARRPGGGMHLGAAMFLVHELTHVWQWQNRERTGYSLLRVGAEHRGRADPYLFDPETNARFLDYGYEQQASMVEEYVCCLALDPEGARTQRLHALLAQEMEPGALPEVDIWLPWAGVEPRGICG